ERLVLAEKLEAKAAPRKRFADVFELTLSAISSPCSVWENGTLGRRRALLKVAFEDRPIYCRYEGFRTPKTSMVFRMLDQFCSPKAVLAEGMGFEPTIGCYPYNGLANRRLQPLGHPSAGRGHPVPELVRNRTAYARPFYGPEVPAVKPRQPPVRDVRSTGAAENLLPPGAAGHRPRFRPQSRRCPLGVPRLATRRA